MARKETPEIDAASMADIAFLLLIFFLVTTTMDVDSGIPVKLTEKQEENVDKPIVKERNVFEVSINSRDELLVEGDEMSIEELTEAAIKFIDNGGGLGKKGDNGEDGTSCDYCAGEKDEASSDHPNKAVIIIESSRGTSFGMYVSVRNELLKSYRILRNIASTNLPETGGRSYDQLLLDYKNSNKKDEDTEVLIKKVKGMYPQLLSDVDPQK